MVSEVFDRLFRDMVSEYEQASGHGVKSAFVMFDTDIGPQKEHLQIEQIFTNSDPSNVTEIVNIKIS